MSYNMNICDCFWETGVNNNGIGANNNQYYISDTSKKLTIQYGTGKIGISTDTKVRSVLSNSAGTNVSWNADTNKFDVLNVVKNGDINFSLGNGNGTLSTIPTITLKGNNGVSVSSQIIFADNYTAIPPYNQGMVMYFNSNNNTFHISGDNNNDGIIDSPPHFTIKRIDGNVGIGTTNPLKKLDVIGDVNVTGTYYINGIAINNFSGVYSDLTGTPTIPTIPANYDSLYYRKSDLVKVIERTGYLISTFNGIYTYEASFKIMTNLILNEYGRPQLQYRYWLSMSIADSSLSSHYWAGFVFYDQQSATFAVRSAVSNTSGWSLTWEWGPWGDHYLKVVFTHNSNLAQYLNVNFC